MMLRQLLVAGLVALALATTAGASTVRPLLIDEIVDNAAVAFEGTCTGNRTERDATTNLVVTYTTFAVRDVLKGAVPSSYTIKQIGGVLPGPNQPIYRVDGVPTFVAGQDYVVLLAGVSAAGFSSPVGLAQGKFSVSVAASGARVSNGRDFREMTAGIPAALLPTSIAKSQGATSAAVKDLGIDEFKQLVRARAGRPQ